jgi:hypothetical protein
MLPFSLLVSIYVQCTIIKNINHICAKIRNIFSKHPKINMDRMARHMSHTVTSSQVCTFTAAANNRNQVSSTWSLYRMACNSTLHSMQILWHAPHFGGSSFSYIACTPWLAIISRGGRNEAAHRHRNLDWTNIMNLMHLKNFSPSSTITINRTIQSLRPQCSDMDLSDTNRRRGWQHPPKHSREDEFGFRSSIREAFVSSLAQRKGGSVCIIPGCTE